SFRSTQVRGDRAAVNETAVACTLLIIATLVKPPVQRTGACRCAVRARGPRAPGVNNARVAREVDASTSEQNGARQSLTGLVVGETNRCLPGDGSPARSPVLSTGYLQAGRDNFGDKMGTSGFRVS